LVLEQVGMEVLVVEEQGQVEEILSLLEVQVIHLLLAHLKETMEEMATHLLLDLVVEVVVQ